MTKKRKQQKTIMMMIKQARKVKRMTNDDFIEKSMNSMIVELKDMKRRLADDKEGSAINFVLDIKQYDLEATKILCRHMRMNNVR